MEQETSTEDVRPYRVMAEINARIDGLEGHEVWKKRARGKAASQLMDLGIPPEEVMAWVSTGAAAFPEIMKRKAQISYENRVALQAQKEEARAIADAKKLDATAAEKGADREAKVKLFTMGERKAAERAGAKARLDYIKTAATSKEGPKKKKRLLGIIPYGEPEADVAKIREWANALYPPGPPSSLAIESGTNAPTAIAGANLDLDSPENITARIKARRMRK